MRRWPAEEELEMPAILCLGVEGFLMLGEIRMLEWFCCLKPNQKTRPSLRLRDSTVRGTHLKSFVIALLLLGLRLESLPLNLAN